MIPKGDDNSINHDIYIYTYVSIIMYVHIIIYICNYLNTSTII